MGSISIALGHFIHRLLTRYFIDHEAAISGEAFTSTADESVIILQFSGTESQKSLDVGERYPTNLRRVFYLMHRALPELHPDTALRMALNVMNDTMGSD